MAKIKEFLFIDGSEWYINLIQIKNASEKLPDSSTTPFGEVILNATV